MKIDLSRFQAAFFEEAAEHVATMEEGLLQLERRPDDLDLINRIFRAAHSIKGNSGMFELTAVTEFTHVLENLLDSLRTGQRAVTKPVMDVLLESTDGLKLLMDAAKTGASADESLLAPVRQRLLACIQDSRRVTAAVQSAQAGDASRSQRVHVRWIPAATLLQRGLDPVQIIKDLEELGSVQTTLCGEGDLPPLADMDPERCYLSWDFVLDSQAPMKQIEDVFVFVREDSQLTFDVDPTADADSTVKPLSVPAKLSTPAAADEHGARTAGVAVRRTDGSSIRVDTEKIDKLINLVGELVITQSMLSQLGTRFDLPDLPVLQERLAQLERNTRELQERVMSIRMLPVGMVFNKFPRVVRDLAARSSKQIELLLTGEETELDKSVIESIGDPLTHLIRNAADHGLEAADERVRSGKRPQGTIRLSAYQEGGNIFITVADDGRGLDRDRILAKAVRTGLVAPGDKLTDEQVWQLIFRAGFSTAEHVTEVSGRGVGMDVVKRNIEALGGTITIKTTAGHGTTFVLKLPLTLAIVEGMAVRVGTETYIVPLLSIIESLQPKSSSVKSVVGKGQVVNVRGVYIPIVRLCDAFRCRADFSDPTQAILIIVETDGERVALMVDELLGQQQVVIKSLEHNFHKVEGIAGATILADGTVGFIVDVRGMVALSRMVPAAA